MAFALIRHGGIHKNQKYLAAMNRLHKGQWKEAIGEFETLLQEFPENKLIKEMLEDARFKAGFDSKSRVRARRWVFRRKAWVSRTLVLIGIALFVWQGSVILQRQIAPILAARAERLETAQWLDQGLSLLAAGDWEQAETRLKQVLGREPTRVEALTGLEQIVIERDLLARYTTAVKLQESGDCAAANKLYGELALERADYKDIPARVKACVSEKDIASLLLSAKIYDSSNNVEEAIPLYGQLRKLGVKVLEDGTSLDKHLSALYYKWAMRGFANPPLSYETLIELLTRLGVATQLDPGNDPAIGEQRQLELYLKAEGAYNQRQWQQAVTDMRAVYIQRPLYLKGRGIPLLYESYIGYGDSLRDAGDCAQAYEQYNRARALTVPDTTLAVARSDSVLICITPTATVTHTPIPTNTPAPTGTPRPTALPAPLSSHRNQIVYKSDNPQQPGFWKMNADGTNKTFLASFDYGPMQEQYNALIEKYKRSPDGNAYAYVARVNDIAQIWIGRTDNAIRPRAITGLADITYDPQWSPNGAMIAFVSQDQGSDDVWLINADGSEMRWLVNNDWEWDKWPSWSPDSTRIAFMSNRYGNRQIYVMDTNGRGTLNLSEQPWDEYDPLWVR